MDHRHEHSPADVENHDYIAQHRGMPKHNYMADHKELSKHLANSIHTGNTKTWMRDMPHMAGAHAMKESLLDHHMGNLAKVREELVDAINYIYMYETTKNPYYKEMAHHELKDVRHYIDSIHDPAEHKLALEFLHKAHMALDKLDVHYHGGDKAAAHDMGEHTGGNPGNRPGY